MNENTRKTILLVEDEAIIALAEKKALELYGYAVLTASSGEKALTVISGSPKIDLILMDINLGTGIDGTQTAEIILKDRDIPIIFLSSHSEREVVEKTEKITSYGYVVKNSSITVLDASIKMAFKLFDEKEKSKLVTGKLEATLDALPDVLFEVDLDGLYFHIHSSKSETLLRPASELVGKKIRDVLPAEVADLHMAAIHEAHENGYSLGRQYLLAVPAGEKWFELSVSRMMSQDDQPHFMILRRDITDRMKAEELILGYNSYLQAIIETTVDGFWIVDDQKNILRVNDAYCRMSGYSKEDFRHIHINDLDAEENPQDTENRIQRIIKNGYEIFETKHRRKDGSVFNVEISTSFLNTDGGQLICFCRDISERKK